jgi:hypothetical protein
VGAMRVRYLKSFQNMDPHCVVRPDPAFFARFSCRSVSERRRRAGTELGPRTPERRIMMIAVRVEQGLTEKRSGDG